MVDIGLALGKGGADIVANSALIFAAFWFFELVQLSWSTVKDEGV